MSKYGQPAGCNPRPFLIRVPRWLPLASALLLPPAFSEDAIDWDAYSAPDRNLVPGTLNPAVTQENIQQTVCVPGWTKSVRPPTSYTQKLEQQQISDWRLPGHHRDYKEDHLIPLCVGGHPDDPGNLWPSPVSAMWNDKIKDQLESSVCRAVCRGAMTLREGQDIFMKEPDWRRAWEKFFSDQR
jgi:hypothetical protein